MIDKEMLIHLKPTDPEDPQKKMPFTKFCEKAAKLLPNFPEDVLDQWPYEAFDCFLEGAARGMEYDRFLFNLEEWDLDKLLSVKDLDDFYERGICWGLVDGTFKNRISIFMEENNTWPRPIIIMDTTESNVDGAYNYLKPYHLLEGHVRLVVLQRMVDMGKPVLSKHKVWVVRQR